MSNTDGTIQQYRADGTSLGLYTNTGLHNLNMVFIGLMVTTQDGPMIEVEPDGSQLTLATVAGGDGIAFCAH